MEVVLTTKRRVSQGASGQHARLPIGPGCGTFDADMVQGGTYIAVFHLRKRQRIRVGRLGIFWFERGVYFYAGSAKRNLTARIERHSRKDKPLRWHIDYLSVHAEMIGAMLVPEGRVPECELAVELLRLYEQAVPGFGSSDCRCRGHLFYAASL